MSKIILYIVQSKVECFQSICSTKQIYSILLIKRIANIPFLQRGSSMVFNNSLSPLFHLFAYFSRTCKGQFRIKFLSKNFFSIPFLSEKYASERRKATKFFHRQKQKLCLQINRYLKISPRFCGD